MDPGLTLEEPLRLFFGMWEGDSAGVGRFGYREFTREMFSQLLEEMDACQNQGAVETVYDSRPLISMTTDDAYARCLGDRGVTGAERLREFLDSERYRDGEPWPVYARCRDYRRWPPEDLAETGWGCRRIVMPDAVCWRMTRGAEVIETMALSRGDIQELLNSRYVRFTFRGMVRMSCSVLVKLTGEESLRAVADSGKPLPELLRDRLRPRDYIPDFNFWEVRPLVATEQFTPETVRAAEPARYTFRLSPEGLAEIRLEDEENDPWANAGEAAAAKDTGDTASPTSSSPSGSGP